MKVLSTLVILTLLIGCSGLQLSGDPTTVTLVKITAREIGCEVAHTGDAKIDRTLRNLYTLAKTGKLSQDAMDQITEELSSQFDDRPTLVMNLTDLVGMIGVQFTPDGQAVGLNEVDPAVFEAVEAGYLSGFNLCGGK